MIRRVADRYSLGRQLGAGGTSRVHAAHDERLGREVAIKLLDAARVATADPAGRERFLREGPTTASFSHRNAVTVFDAGEDADDLYIVMELVDGPSLAERLAKSGALAVDEATDIARQVLAALAAAHNVGIVHRDVKPANVLLGANGDVKLADFGIAKRFDDLDESVTSAGMVIGTPRYLAPEQAAGATATAATDIYAVGILLFEMLTGNPLSPSMTDVRPLRPDVTDELAAIVMRALATKPADRFGSASDMSAALDDPSAMATQVMQLAPPTAGAADTQIMPSPIVATPRTTATSRTTARTPGLVGLFAVLAIAVVIVVVLANRGDTKQLGAAPDTTVSAVATVPGETTTPTTSMPATSTSVAEIIPGFAQTDDIEIFLEQLEADPDLVGQRGEELAEMLSTMLDERSPKKQRDQARDIREELAEWVDDEELDAAIAKALDELLEPFAE